ncbi:MAG: hypothetical protein U1F68_19770 [Gammaproteobacteria bacterium]
MRYSQSRLAGVLLLTLPALPVLAAESLPPIKAFTLCDIDECVRKISGTAEECAAIVKAEADAGHCGAPAQSDSPAARLADGDRFADAGDYAAAYEAYLKAHELAAAARKELRIRIAGSLAATLVKLERIGEAARYCQEILALDANNQWARDLLQRLEKSL